MNPPMTKLGIGGTPLAAFGWVDNCRHPTAEGLQTWSAEESTLWQEVMMIATECPTHTVNHLNAYVDREIV